MRAAILLLLPAVLQGQPGPAQPANCSADGYVVNAITGEPVARAVVQFTGRAVAVTTADSSGRWKISGIACGRIAVVASKAGFLNPGQGRPPYVSGPVAAPDSPVHDLKVDLMPQAVITGKVIDEAGDPVQNAQIMVMTSRVLEGRRAFAQNGGGVTNDLGEFRIPGQAAGKAIVCVRPPNDPLLLAAPNTVFGENCYPGPVEGGSASAMTLAAGREARVDFTLSRVPAVRIRGKVTGMPEGRGVMVSLQPRTMARNGAQTRQANMSRDGTFEVRGVAPGAWLLAVDYWEAGNRLFARVPVDVGGADVDGVNVHVEAGFTVTGTVRVASESGNAPNFRQVNLNLRGTDMTSGTGGVKWDEDHKSFTIADATPGSYMLNLNAPAPFYLKSAMLGGRDLAREAVSISQEAGPIDVVLADDAGSIEGRLEDTNGEAATGWVMAWREGRPPVPGLSGPDGKFRLAGLPPGDYRVFGWDDFQQVEWADADWMRRNGGSGIAVSVASGQTVEVKVARMAVPRD